MRIIVRYIYYDRHSTIVVSTSDEVKAKCLKHIKKGARDMGGISSDVIRGYNDTLILYLLLREPSYGYEISKQIKSLSEDKYIIKETTLYSAFTRMEKNGYVESYSAEGTGGKKRTYYKITESGIKYYEEKCDEWNITKEVIEKFIDNNLQVD